MLWECWPEQLRTSTDKSLSQTEVLKISRVFSKINKIKYFIFYINFNRQYCRQKTRLDKYLSLSLGYVVVVVYVLGTLADNQFGLRRR